MMGPMLESIPVCRSLVEPFLMELIRTRRRLAKKQNVMKLDAQRVLITLKCGSTRWNL